MTKGNIYKPILFKKDKNKIKVHLFLIQYQKRNKIIWFYKQRKNFFLNVQIILQLLYSCNQI